ncbi:eukaryotic translation elongation factor 1 epsilon-1 [Narcine bancroftii]|uniref:eukaryotic translation elongation factor 1 epsilon-1 n=1 Tax=Narcine bancroftii TaxID=1343680 RepID=UPI0038313E3F
MADAALELASLKKTLGLTVPELQTNTNYEGLTTIASHLVKVAKKEQLLGTTPEKSALVQQWLEYRVTQIDRRNNQDDKRVILKELDCYLEDKVYMAGNSFTLADIMLYNGLHPIMAALTHEDREKYVNVSRWFNHIQHYPGVRQHSPVIIFVKNRLYPTVH